MHLIALKLKAKTGIPWLADFRDPWTGIEYFNDLRLSKRNRRLHSALEKKVLTNANAVVTVSKAWAVDLEKISGRAVEVITNGFNADDFKPGIMPDKNHFTISHIGTLSADRNPTALWQSLGELCRNNPEFKRDLRLRFIGKTDQTVLLALKQNSLIEQAEVKNYTAHDEVIAFMQESCVLLLCQTRESNAPGHIPGKLFEYLAARRPVIFCGDLKSDAAEIIGECKAGNAFGFDEKEKISAVLLAYYTQWKAGMLSVSSTGIERYERKMLTGRMGDLLHSIKQITER
jgi:glycosyltransferase involved in cell wall biosynthesis